MNQVLRCVESAVSLGITHFRLTGGEPLCYPKIEELLCKIKQIKGVDSVHLTTNGVLLKEKAATAETGRHRQHQCQPGYAG